jgi:hypothetical protein
LLVAGSLVVGLLVWRTASRVREYDEQSPSVAVEPILDGRFLGLQLNDRTRDQFGHNAWLRMAMNEGFTAADSVRRFQMEAIHLQEGQHPATGEPAVLVSIEPKEFEMPDPPFATVAVRRGRPRTGPVLDANRRRELSRNLPPQEEDLASLRQEWSGNRYSDVNSLVTSFRYLAAGIVGGLGLLILAGAYRTLAWQTTRWNISDDHARSDAALARFHTAREIRREQARLDS